MKAARRDTTGSPRVRGPPTARASARILSDSRPRAGIEVERGGTVTGAVRPLPKDAERTSPAGPARSATVRAASPVVRPGAPLNARAHRPDGRRPRAARDSRPGAPPRALVRLARPATRPFRCGDPSGTAIGRRAGATSRRPPTDRVCPRMRPRCRRGGTARPPPRDRGRRGGRRGFPPPRRRSSRPGNTPSRR